MKPLNLHKLYWPEQRRIQNAMKLLKQFFTKTVNAFQPLNNSVKRSILNIWHGSGYVSVFYGHFIFNDGGSFFKKEVSLTFDPLLDWLKLHEGKNQQKFCTDWDHTKNYKECPEVVGYK